MLHWPASFAGEAFPQHEMTCLKEDGACMHGERSLSAQPAVRLGEEHQPVFRPWAQHLEVEISEQQPVFRLWAQQLAVEPLPLVQPDIQP